MKEQKKKIVEGVWSGWDGGSGCVGGGQEGQTTTQKHTTHTHRQSHTLQAALGVILMTSVTKVSVTDLSERSREGGHTNTPALSHTLTPTC